VVIVQEILADHRQLQHRSRLPGDPHVQLSIGRDLLVGDLSDVAKRAVQAQMRG